MNPLRVLVVTCAHRGDDARIVQRQISAMLDAGFEVTLIAPEPLQTQVQQHVIIRRAIGRRRVSSWFDVLRNVAKHRKTVDLLLVHDLEIAGLLSFMPGLPPRIFDVHEDLARKFVIGPRLGDCRLAFIYARFTTTHFRRPRRSCTKCLGSLVDSRGTQLNSTKIGSFF